MALIDCELQAIVTEIRKGFKQIETACFKEAVSKALAQLSNATKRK